jgi:phosphatidylinositol-bisphosphatase
VLDAILVVHFEHGVDFYVSIHGKYLRSSFGCTLEWLVARPAPVRSSEAPLTTRAAHLLVPKELWLLCDQLQRALDDPALFQQSGEASEILALREQLDSSVELSGSDAASIHSVAELLVRWLSALAEPVVPAVHYAEALNAAASPRRCRTLLTHFPLVHYRAFYYVVALLKARVRAREPHGDDEARAEVARLCALFGPALLRPGHAGRPSLAGRRRAALFLSHFLVPNAEALAQQ